MSCSLGARFQDVDFDGIQCIVDTLSDPKVAAAAQADPQNFMISEMQKNNIPVPDGLHFHWRKATSLFHLKPEIAFPLLQALCLQPHQASLMNLSVFK